MRAWIVNNYGEPADVLAYEDNAASFEVKSDQVRVKVEAAGLGLPDVFSCRNSYPLTPPLPFVPSQEAAGTIVEVGKNVDPNLSARTSRSASALWMKRAKSALACLRLAYPSIGATSSR